jgi:hypothetical protein
MRSKNISLIMSHNQNAGLINPRQASIGHVTRTSFLRAMVDPAWAKPRLSLSLPRLAHACGESASIQGCNNGDKAIVVVILGGGFRLQSCT